MSDNRTAIFDALAACGATYATITYDGSGDSGQMNEVDCDGNGFDKVRIQFERAETAYSLAESGRFEPQTKNEMVEITLSAAIEEFCWDVLEEKHGGWENDEGADGNFHFDVEGRSVSFEHNEFYTSTNTSHYEV